MKFIFIFIFFVIACKGIRTQNTETKSDINNKENCNCIGIGDTIYLSGGIKLLRCRNDSFMYFLAIKDKTCYSFWEELYDEERMYSDYCMNIYDFNRYFVMEHSCGGSYITCFHILSKKDFNTLFYGELLGISEKEAVILYNRNYDTEIDRVQAYFLNTDFHINYAMPKELEEILYYSEGQVTIDTVIKNSIYIKSPITEKKFVLNKVLK